MPRKSRLEKQNEKDDIPFVADTDEETSEETPLTLKRSRASPTKKVICRRKSKKQAKKIDYAALREQRFAEFRGIIENISTQTLVDIAPDFALVGYSIRVDLGQRVPDFGEPIVATFCLVADDDETFSISNTITTHSLMEDAPAAVVALIGLHCDLMGDVER